MIIFLVMEEVIGNLKEANIALFSDNTPTISWVMRRASRHSIVAANLVAAPLPFASRSYAAAH